LVFRTKSIIVAEGAGAVERRPLAKLDGSAAPASRDVEAARQKTKRSQERP
jgi:hypothetical protein